MHRKATPTRKNRALMIRTQSSKQLTLAAFDWPFQTDLDDTNRWVQLSACIPWDDLAERYYQELSSTQGRPAKDARLVIGAMIIKHKLNLSDRETVAQIQENPYLQYFVGLPGYQMEAPFAAPLFVEIRRRMGPAVFEGFHESIIDALEQDQVESARQTPSTVREKRREVERRQSAVSSGLRFRARTHRTPGQVDIGCNGCATSDPLSN